MNQLVPTRESQAFSHADEMSLILTALTQLRRGDARARLPYHGAGAFGKVAEVFNDLVEQSAMMADEVSRLSQVVGKQGKLKKRAALPNAHGFWAESIDCMNSLIDDLVHPTSEVARVIGAVAQGDLSKSMALELDGRPLEGEFLRTAKTINKMVEQLGNFSAEVTRVARAAGAKGVRAMGSLQELPAPLARAVDQARERGHDVELRLSPSGAARVVPLKAGERVLGVLLLRHQGRPLPYGAPDQATLDELCSRAAIAFDNARLYWSLKREMARTKEAEEKLQQANRRKDEFLAMLSHELRNPLAPIRNAAEVMRRIAPSDPGISWAREVVERQVTHLAQLVDDLLDVSRITQGKITLKKEPVELGRVIQHSVETARTLLDSKRHNLMLNLPATPIWVHGDFARLAQVVGNLLHNGAKYTAEGGTIELAASADRGEAIVTVRDNGIGIDGTLLPHVFELFTQGERSLDRSQGGLGVGLTVVQRLMELHQGRVEVASDGAGKGSLFRVVLPCISEVPERDPVESAPRGETSRAGKRVLVVDDNIDAAESIAVYLRLEGHDVRTVSDGLQAVAVAQVFAPHVAVVDIGLPGMNGYDVARRLKNQGADAPALLIALTGYGQREDRARSQEAGFHHHFVKPADPRIIQSAIAEWAPPFGAAVQSSAG